MNQVYKIRRNIWQVFNYNFTESRLSKLGEKNTVRSLYVFEWCLCRNYLSFYIWTPIELLYKHWSMFWIFGDFDIVTIIFCHSVCLLYHVWLCSCQPCDLTLLFSYLSLTIRLETISVKWSIITLSRLSKVIQQLASHQFLINQVYQIRRNFWQDINDNFTESIKNKLCEFVFSVVQFCLVHFSIQVSTWRWSNYWRGLICTKAVCVSFSDIDELVGK